MLRRPTASKRSGLTNMEARRPVREIEQASLDDFEALKTLLDRANQYAAELSGVRMWTVMDHVYDGLKRQLEHGDCYVVRVNDAPTAMISVSEESGEWDALDGGNNALYFYKWMKDPAVGTAQDGLQLLNFAAQNAKQKGKDFLRCDTVAEMPGLIDYYHRLGFVRKGDFTYESSGRPGLLLEAKVETVLERTTALE